MFKWIASIYARFDSGGSIEDLSTASTQLEAKAARENAKFSYQKIAANRPKVDALVKESKSQNHKNHFAEMITAAMIPPPAPPTIESEME